MELIVDFPQATSEELAFDIPRSRRFTFPQTSGISYQSQTTRVVGLPPIFRPRTRRRPLTSFGVSFSDRATVTLVENLSLQHGADLWFSKREMDSFKKQAALLLRTMASNDVTVAEYAEMHLDDTSAFMGLEDHMTPSATGRIRERRGAVRRAVWLEQWRQNATSAFDPDAMRRALEEITAESFQRAQVIAMLHASNHDEI